MKEKKQITLRVPENIYKKIKEQAERIDISVHEYIMVAINEFIQSGVQK